MDAITTCVKALTERLDAGKACETRLGLFLTREYARYEGKNPRTGQVVVVAAKRLPFLLVSDELSAQVLGRDFRTDEETRAGYAEDDLPIPEADETVDCDAIYAEVVEQLAHGERAVVEALGEFVIRGFTVGAQRVITFTPSAQLRGALNLVEA